MTRNEFIQHLEAPHYVNGEDIVGLQEVIQQFPYCQSAQLLLTKAFHESENLNFERQLKKSAAYAADRRRLHALLFTNKLPNLANYPKPEFDAEEDPIELSETTTSHPEVNSHYVQPENFPTIPEENTEQTKSTQPDETAESDHRKTDTLEQQILVEAINSSILLEVEEKEEDYSVIIEDHKAEIISESKEHNQFDDSTTHTFSDWLNFFKDKKESTQEEERPSLWERTSKESKEMISAFSPNSNLPVKTEFYSPAKMARLSVQEDNDLITETLANIYYEQGNFEKAIIAFEKLQQKIPEKSSYFASRIKEIQNQLNS